MSIMFPRSRVKEFYNTHPTWRDSKMRFGQLFYDYMQLDKVVNTDDKAVCERIYQADSLSAQQIVIKHTDWEN